MTNHQRYQLSKAIWNIPWLILTLSVLLSLFIIDDQPEYHDDYQQALQLLAGQKGIE